MRRQALTAPAFALLVTALAVVACVVVGAIWRKVREWDEEDDP